MGAFPGTVEPKSEMSEDLLEHVRYPEDLFKVQRYQFARYHVSDASDWYENNDRWDGPRGPAGPGRLPGALPALRRRERTPRTSR